MTNTGCWLCGSSEALCDSHVIPKFVFKWLKNTGGTPFLRNGENPNLRRQDGDKHKLYCNSCEQIFSKHERTVRERVFIPATRKEQISGRYGPWLSRFSASLALRTLHSMQYRELQGKFPEAALDDIKTAEATWKSFLLGKSNHPGKFKQQSIYCGQFHSFDAPDLPENWNVYINRAVERDLVTTPDNSLCCTYTKLGPLIFFGVIRDTTGILGSDFLRCQEGNYSYHPFKPSRTVWNYLIERARNAMAAIDSISEKQRLVSEQEVSKRMDEFLGSEQFQALWDDHKQFGPRKTSSSE